MRSPTTGDLTKGKLSSGGALAATNAWPWHARRAPIHASGHGVEPRAGLYVPEFLTDRALDGERQEEAIQHNDDQQGVEPRHDQFLEAGGDQQENQRQDGHRHQQLGHAEPRIHEITHERPLGAAVAGRQVAFVTGGHALLDVQSLLTPGLAVDHLGRFPVLGHQRLLTCGFLLTATRCGASFARRLGGPSGCSLILLRFGLGHGNIAVSILLTSKHPPKDTGAIT